MGIFDKIKETYKKVDTKLGGYLPGGQSPSEVKQSKAAPAAPVSTPQQSQAPTQSVGSSQPQAPVSSSSSGSSGNTVVKSANYSPTPNGMISAAGPKPNVFQRFASGLKQGFTLNGQDLRDAKDLEGRPTVEQAGSVVGLVGGIAAEGLGGELAALKIGNLLKARKASRALSAAEKAGASIDIPGALVRVGDNIADTGKVITNTKEAKILEELTVNTAKQVSPNNWRTILGMFKNNAGKAKNVAKGAVGLGGAALLSEMISINAISDNVDRLGFAADSLADSGDIEGANQLLDLQAEAVEFSQSFSSYIPFYQVAPSLSRFFRDQLTANELKREALNSKYEKAQAEEAGFEGQIDEEGNYIPTELEKARNAFYEGADGGEGGQLDEEGNYIPTDLDLARNEYYNPETDSVEVYGDQDGGEEYTTSSTLGFGLLDTGGQYAKGEGKEDGPTIQELNGEAVNMFGLPYDELSPQQKAFVDAQRGE